MNYIQRALEGKILEATRYSPVIMVCGPRQVGKSTMLKHIKEKEREAVTLRVPEILKDAQENPSAFFEIHKPPILLDEFQLEPSLLSVVQYIVDEKETQGEDCNGMFWLTGSHKIDMEKYIRESLVGRCTIFNMPSLSSSELEGRNAGIFMPDIDSLMKRASHFSPKSSDEILDRIFYGSMPRLYNQTNIPHDEFYNNYIEEYLMRDVQEFTGKGNSVVFRRFLTYMARYTAQELNYDTICSTFGKDKSTIEDWVSILVNLGVICILPPFYKSPIKQFAKSSKYYFMDTGLAARLSGFKTVKDLRDTNTVGAFFETHVVSEIIKSYYNAGKNPENLFYYRDKKQKEIDLIITSEDRKIYPIEIKYNVNPSGAGKNISALTDKGPESKVESDTRVKLDEHNMDVQPATIICQCEAVRAYGENAWLFPVSGL